MQSEGSLPCTQEPSTGFNPESDKCTPYPHTLFSEDLPYHHHTKLKTVWNDWFHYLLFCYFSYRSLQLRTASNSLFDQLL